MRSDVHNILNPGEKSNLSHIGLKLQEEIATYISINAIKLSPQFKVLRKNF